jgi:hypothetical protein
MKRQITRKEFLASTTKTALAMSAGAAAMSVFPVSGQQPRPAGQAGVIDKAGTPWPWPYQELDPEYGRKLGHKFYYDGGCAYGAFHGLITALAEKIGEPYTLLPTQMMYFGGGGGAGWGTLCGALNGAAAAISIPVDRANANLIVSELFGWYTEFPFPSDTSNDYATARAFLTNRNDKPLKQTVSGSTLCHTSVSIWCSEAGVKTGAPERAERCARLTGDCVARSIELMNAFFRGQFRPAFVVPASVTACQGCHGTSIANVQASVKMDCQQCHKPNWDHLR